MGRGHQSEEYNASVAEWLYHLLAAASTRLDPLPLSLAAVAACRRESDMAVENALYDVIQNNIGDVQQAIEITSELISRASEVKQISVEDLRRLAEKSTDSGEVTIDCHLPGSRNNSTSQNISKWLYDLLSAVSPSLSPLSVAIAVFEACQLEVESEVKASLYDILSKNISEVGDVIKIMHELVPRHIEIREQVTAEDLESIALSSDPEIQRNDHTSGLEQTAVTATATHHSDASTSEITARQLYDMLSALPSQTDPLTLALAVHKGCQRGSSTEIESALYEVLQQSVMEEELVIEIMVELVPMAKRIRRIEEEDFLQFSLQSDLPVSMTTENGTTDSAHEETTSPMSGLYEERFDQAPNTSGGQSDQNEAFEGESEQEIFESVWNSIPDQEVSTIDYDEGLSGNRSSGSDRRSIPRLGSRTPLEQDVYIGEEAHGTSCENVRPDAQPVRASSFAMEQRQSEEQNTPNIQVSRGADHPADEGSADIAEGPEIMVEAYLVEDNGSEIETPDDGEKGSARHRRGWYLDGRLLIAVAILIAAAVVLTIYFMGGFG